MQNLLSASLIACVAVVSALGAQSGAAQSGASLEAPSIAGGWVLRVSTHGGILGQQLGDIVIASDGRLSCPGPKARCAPAVAVEGLRSLHDQVRLASLETWLVLRPSGICSDCLTTTMVLTSREADGTLRTIRAVWDPTTRGQLAEPVGRIRDVVARLVAAAQRDQPLTR
jgi:hypothetical protein